MATDKSSSVLKVSEFSFLHLEELINRRPSLIVPVGSLEPAGEDLPLGVVNSCCEAVANELSKRLEVLVAPLLPYGNSIPFKAFGGSAGVHRDTLEKFLIECCNCWFFQGIKRILLITLSMDGRQGIESAVKRMTKAPSRINAVKYVSLQDDERFRSMCASRFRGLELGRSEWGIRALAGYLWQEPKDKFINKNKRLPDADEFKKWYRRGRDPEKLRKMAPHASLSAFPASGKCDIEEGRELFNGLIGFLGEEFAPFLTFTDNASK